MILQMGLAFGYFNGFWWFFCFKNSGFVFNEEYDDLSILYWIPKFHKNPFMHLEKGILRFLPLLQQK
jgi:hypothetical protein